MFDNSFKLDQRDLILAVVYQYFKEQNSFNSINLKKRIAKVETMDDVEEILTKLTPIDKGKTMKGIALRSRELIEAQDDLIESEKY